MKLYLWIVIGLISLNIVFANSLNNAQIKSVKFIGNKNIKSNSLQKIINVQNKSIFTDLPFDRRVIKLDAISIKNYYLTNGYLDVSVVDSFSVNEKSADIYFRILEGKQYFLNSINISGNNSLKDEEIFSLLNLRKNYPFNPVGIQINRNRLDDRYFENSKLFTNIKIDPLVSDSVTVNIIIDDIREIIDSVSYSTSSARFKIYIIDEVHMLSKSAFNGLLKTLEEPPPHVKFIFATTEVHKVPLTILSRCQKFDLRQLDEVNMLKLLKSVCQKEKADISDNILSIIGRAAAGSARDGLSILDQAITLAQSEKNLDKNSIREMLGLSDHARIIELFKSISMGNIESALKEIKDQIELGAEPINIISSLGDIVHELTLLKVSKVKNDNLFLGPENFSKLTELLEDLDVRKLSRFWQMILKADTEIKNSFNAFSALEMVVIRMAYVSELPTPAEIIESVEGREENKKKKLKSKIISNPKNIDKNTKNNSFDNIGSFEDIIELAGKYKFLILKKFLQEDVRLVSFENGHIDINVPEGSEEIIKELIVKLYDWTDQRWIINVSSKKGEDTILEKQNNIQNNIVDEVSNKEEIKKVMEAFPDSKITSISKVDNRNESK